MISKIALGTVQFGLNYGINNTRGRIPVEEVRQILQYCKNIGINFLDTAAAYGDSESVIGDIQQELDFSFKIVSKLPHGSKSDIKKTIAESCGKLKVENLYGFLFHSFSDYKNNPLLFDRLKEIRNSGKVEKIGFSLYNPEEAQELLDGGVKFDLVQVPYNIFDQRFDNIFDSLKKKEIEIHTRSTFLQGLFFKRAENLSVHFSSIKSKLKEFQKILRKHEIPLASGLLNFALLNENIDKVVIGIDNLDNLKENLKALDYLKSTQAIYPALKNFQENNLQIILPTLWKNIG